MKRFPALLFSFILIVACASIAESQPEKVRIAISSISTSQVNVWVPLDTGFFKKQGLDVELVYISGAPVGASKFLRIFILHPLRCAFSRCNLNIYKKTVCF